MNITELRPGNKVIMIISKQEGELDKKEELEVTVHSVYGKSDTFPYGAIRYGGESPAKTVGCSQIKGIDLSVWLKKHPNEFKFSLDQDYSIYENAILKMTVLPNSDVMCKIFNAENKDTVKIFKLKYLHQLQNLYFALSECKKELPL